MLLHILVDILVWYFLPKLNNHLSSYEFENLEYTEWPFGSLLSLMENDFVNILTVFHHLNISGNCITKENIRYRSEPSID